MKKLMIMAWLFLLPACTLIKKWFAKPKEAAVEKEEKMTSSAPNENINFLKENKKKPGVKETASGLQYKVIKEGAGASPQKNSQVEVHYRGTLINGEEFDSSYSRGQTASFGLMQVIPGWTEGLQLMKEGAVFEFYIPSPLAYGSQRLPGIPPNSTLIFKVELIKIQP